MTHLVLLALAVLVAVGETAGAANRLPVPGPEEQAKAARTLDEVYGSDLKSAQTLEQSRAVTRRMLQAADESGDDAAGRYLLLSRARKAAAEAGDVETAASANEQIDRAFAVADPTGEWTAVLTQLARTVRPGGDAALLVGKMDDVISLEISRDEYDMATRLADLAAAVAPRSNDAALVRLTAAQKKDVREIGDAFALAKKSLQAARQSQDDPQANLIAGRFICFIKGDWAGGLPLLGKGADATLAGLAREELARPADGRGQSALADSWWDLADAEPDGIVRRQIRSHAADWYRQALSSLGGLVKAKAQKRIDEAAATGGAPTAAWVDLLQGIDPARDARRGAWKMIEGGKLALMSDSYEQQRIAFPYSTRGDYDLSIRFSRTHGGGAVCVYLPAGRGECLLALSGWSKQLSALFSAHFTGPEGASVPNDPLHNGHVYQLDVSVRLRGKDVEISVLRDGQQFMHWLGPQADLEVPPEWGLRRPGLFGIGGDDALVVVSARVKALDGGGIQPSR